MVFCSDKQSADIKNLHFSFTKNDRNALQHRREGKRFVALAFAFGFFSGGLLSVLELQWLPAAFTTLKSKLVLKYD
jgi:hypothetical protein